LELLGEKTTEDEEKAKNMKKKPKVKEEKKEEKKEEVSKKFEGREVDDAKNTTELLEKRNKETEGKILTRFPPGKN
jgi:hypothetical protein